ncbi:hypothetical protein ACFL47_09465, partial [Candidatus Latescibacterota bacterium]
MNKFKKRLLIHLPLITVFLIFTAALIIRINYIRQTEVELPIRVDALGYTVGGYNIYRYGVFSEDEPSVNVSPKSIRWPGYSLFIALAFFFSAGDTGFYSILLYAQALLSALLIFPVYYLGRMILPFWWAVSVSILTLFSPHLISMTSYVLS